MVRLALTNERFRPPPLLQVSSTENYAWVGITIGGVVGEEYHSTTADMLQLHLPSVDRTAVDKICVHMEGET